MSDPQERVKRRIRSLTAGWAKAESLNDIRRSFEAAFDDGGSADGLEIAGGPAAWIGDGPKERAILYCHGGGFQIGSIRSHRGLMAKLSSVSETRVLGIDYRLAPEHRFPAALDDVLAAYEWLLETRSRTRIAIAGDSAGGALAIGVALRARDRGRPLPRCLVLISPWLDLAMRGESYHSRADVDVFSKLEQLKAMVRTYLGRDGDPTSPLASPVWADLRGLPPILVHAGDFDITRDDAILLRDRADANGVAVELKIWSEMVHHFQMFPELPETSASIAEIGAFLRRHLR